MTRLAILKWSLGLLLLAGGGYWSLSLVGFSPEAVQIGLTSLLMLGFVIWVVGYVQRVLSGQMALHEQQQRFEKSAMQERLQTMTAEELAQFTQDLESES